MICETTMDFDISGRLKYKCRILVLNVMKIKTIQIILICNNQNESDVLGDCQKID